ncbi:hypothetical protein SESBI_29990 [Sesbania bispinosa]|nr:hypothetical protein SESBI_29990 [Sesbania bispinosa]
MRRRRRKTKNRTKLHEEEQRRDEVVCVGTREKGYRYFKWADEDGFDEQLGLAAVDGVEIVGDKKLKVLKLKKKLDAEKRKAKMFMGVAVGSWVLTLIVCVVCVGKFPCTLF